MTDETPPTGAAVAVERWVGNFLRVATYVAATLLGLGVVTNLASAMPDLRDAAWLAPLDRGLPLLRSGLVVLLAAPVLRVMLAGVLFLRNRERATALLCLVVLAIMATGYILGATHR